MERQRQIKTLLLAGGIALVAGTWAFGMLAGAVAEGETYVFDARFLRATRHADDLTRPVGPAWLPEVMRDVTALGGFPLQILAFLGVTGYLLLAGHRREAVLVVAAILGGFLLSQLLKGSFGRPRPEIVPALTRVASSSFPSGHSLMSAVTFLTLGTLACRFEPDRRLRAGFLCAALLVTALVGVSRVYLGVHHPTDVAAGWAAGLAWAGAWWCGLAWHARRRATAAGEG